MVRRQIILIIISVLTAQAHLFANEPHKAIGVGITAGYQRFNVQYPELSRIGEILGVDSVTGVRPEKNSRGGQVGIGVYYRIGRVVRFEPGLNIRLGLTGGTRPGSRDTSIQEPDYIPNKGEHWILYYGHYTNKSRGMREKVQKAALVPMPLAPLTQQQLRFRLTWAALIKLVYEVDPLKCPTSGR